MNRNRTVVDYYQPDISNSCLYDQSVNVNCILQTEENAKYTKWNTYLNESYVEPSSTSMRCFIEPRDEFKLKTDQYLNDYRCHVDSSTNTFEGDDCLGFECNKGMMYKLDEFNTYHNYPVCRFRDENNKEEMTCCPENIQIFDNITRRNVEIPVIKPDNDLIMNTPIIPQLKYNKCFLY